LLQASSVFLELGLELSELLKLYPSMPLRGRHRGLISLGLDRRSVITLLRGSVSSPHHLFGPDVKAFMRRIINALVEVGVAKEVVAHVKN
jgi:hypothetical protein